MSTRRIGRNQIPTSELEDLMLYIVNLRFPEDDDWEWQANTDDAKESTYRLRERTEKYWPTLWEPVPRGNISTEDRAQFVVRKLRAYLRLFWKASGEERERERDWYIHRAREYYYRLEILPKLLSTPESQRIVESENLLDIPPDCNPIETALYHLQKRAEWRSSAPLVCPTDGCEEPYFLAKKKNQTFCSLECRRPSTLESKRKYAQNRRKRRS